MAALKIAFAQLVLCALLGVIGVKGQSSRRILGGDTADDNEFPYQVSLQNIIGHHKCGGSILDSRHILTAAHCVDKVYSAPSNMTVTAGTNYIKGKGDKHHIKNIKIHPGYSNSSSDSWKNDIAVITLSSPIKLDHRHRPVKLPTSYTAADTRVMACGWGHTSYPKGDTPFNLRKLSMVVVPNNRCRPAGMPVIHETHICAIASKGAGTCSGDSGGPLLLNDGTLVGINSWGIKCGKGFPDVFTRVYSYVDWINEVTGTY